MTKEQLIASIKEETTQQSYRADKVAEIENHAKELNDAAVNELLAELYFKFGIALQEVTNTSVQEYISEEQQHEYLECIRRFNASVQWSETNLIKKLYQIGDVLLTLGKSEFEIFKTDGAHYDLGEEDPYVHNPIVPRILNGSLEVTNDLLPDYDVKITLEKIFEECSEIFEYVNTLEPDNPKYILAWSKALLHLDFDECIIKIETAHKLDPKNPQILIEWGKALHDDDYSGSYKKYEEAYALATKEANVVYELAQQTFQSAHTEHIPLYIKSATLFEEAHNLGYEDITLYKDWAYALHKIGVANNDSNAFEKCIYVFEKTFQKVNEIEKVLRYENWALALFIEQKNNKPNIKNHIKTFELACETAKNHSKLNAEIGNIFVEYGEGKNDVSYFENALKYFEKVTSFKKNKSEFESYAKALLFVGEENEDTQLLKKSAEKFERLTVLDANYEYSLCSHYYLWGNALHSIGFIKDDTDILKESNQKYEQAYKTKKDDAMLDDILKRYGIALEALGILENDELTYQNIFDYFKKGTGNIKTQLHSFIIKKGAIDRMLYSTKNSNTYILNTNKNEIEINDVDTVILYEKNYIFRIPDNILLNKNKLKLNEVFLLDGWQNFEDGEVVADSIIYASDYTKNRLVLSSSYGQLLAVSLDENKLIAYEDPSLLQFGVFVVALFWYQENLCICYSNGHIYNLQQELISDVELEVSYCYTINNSIYLVGKKGIHQLNTEKKKNLFFTKKPYKLFIDFQDGVILAKNQFQKRHLLLIKGYTEKGALEINLLIDDSKLLKIDVSAIPEFNDNNCNVCLSIYLNKNNDFYFGFSNGSIYSMNIDDNTITKYV